MASRPASRSADHSVPSARQPSVVANSPTQRRPSAAAPAASRKAQRRHPHPPFFSRRPGTHLTLLSGQRHPAPLLRRDKAVGAFRVFAEADLNPVDSADLESRNQRFI